MIHMAVIISFDTNYSMHLILLCRGKDWRWCKLCAGRGKHLVVCTEEKQHLEELFASVRDPMVFDPTPTFSICRAYLNGK